MWSMDLEQVGGYLSLAKRLRAGKTALEWHAVAMNNRLSVGCLATLCRLNKTTYLGAISILKGLIDM